MKKEIENLRNKYDANKGWGLLSSIDLHSCNSDLIKNEYKIREFVKKLCDKIEMKMFGETIVVDFGEDERVSGFSLLQLIETSSITGHFVNQTNNVFLDIFSCKFYDPNEAAEFARDFFQAKDYKLYYHIRK